MFSFANDATRSPVSGMTMALLAPLVLALGCSEPAAQNDVGGTSGTGDAAATEEPVVNLYTARHYDADEAVYGAFEEATGIRVEVAEADSAALLERLRREDDQSPADVFIAVDAGRLYQAETEGIFQPVDSEILRSRVPENLRSRDDLWFGLTKRARVIVYARDRVDPSEIQTYEGLADAKWKGRLLIRSSSNIYNQSLVGSLIAALGPEETASWCEGVVSNLARKPQGGDRDQVRAVVAGEGDIAVVNSYYLAQMLAGSPEDRAIAEQVGVVFPNQGGRGAHVNIAGGGIVRGAPHPNNAQKFLEFLTSETAQEIFASGNKEYPVVSGYEVAPELAAFGTFEEDRLNAAVFGSKNQEALELMDRCGWR